MHVKRKLFWLLPEDQAGDEEIGPGCRGGGGKGETVGVGGKSETVGGGGKGEAVGGGGRKVGSGSRKGRNYCCECVGGYISAVPISEGRGGYIA